MPDPTMEKTVAAETPGNVRKSFDHYLSWRAPEGRFFWFSLLLTALFAKVLGDLVVFAAASSLHSYILLVPVISLYLIHDRRDRLPRNYSSSPGLAALLAGVGIIVLPVAYRLAKAANEDYLTLVAFSFVCLVAAGGFFFLGRRWMAAAAFPVVFLMFMVPLPAGLVNMLETASQLASAEAANLFFLLTGTPVLHEGTIFQLPNITIQVGQECSGIRSSLVLFMTSLVAANLFLKSPWRRVVLVAFVIPLGIVRNGIRVWTIATLCIQYGPDMVHSIVHRRGGPVFFTLSLIPLLLLLWWLRRGEMTVAGGKEETLNAEALKR